MIYSCKWSAPSNIALVKYWGKKDIQKPINPSLSFSLNECKTITRLEVSESSELEVEYFFENSINPKFSKRVETFIKDLTSEFSELSKLKLRFYSENTFPHSSGIASSASSFASISLCLQDLLAYLRDTQISFEVASEWARLASGSASRSVLKEFNAWGKSGSLKTANDNYAVNISKVHPCFNKVFDSVLIIDNGQKEVSSSKGHSLFNDSVYKEPRVNMANKNFDELVDVLQLGDKLRFAQIIIEEGLSLHALMMLSASPYMLMKANTISTINKIETLRKDYPEISYTLDAGPNIHLIYFPEHLDIVKNFINKLIEDSLIEDVIFDKIGNGPVKYE
jgi:diphosphomevalonate decarboxylase